MFQERVDAMLSEIAPIVDAWKIRRDNFIISELNAET